MGKKIKRLLTVTLILFFACACGKKEKKEVVAPQKKWITYQIANLEKYAIDDKQNLYTLEWEGVENNQILKLCQYDAEGKQVNSIPLNGRELSHGRSMACGNDGVFFLLNKQAGEDGSDNEIYYYNPVNEQVELIAQFEGGNYVKRLAVCGDSIFIAGVNRTSLLDEGGELISYSLKTRKMEKIKLSNVFDVAPVSDEELLLYLKEEKEYQLLCYNVIKGSARVMASMENQIAYELAMGVQDNTIVYISAQDGGRVIYADLQKVQNGVEIYPGASAYGCFSVVNGWLALLEPRPNYSNVVVMNLANYDIHQNEIRCLTENDGWPNPYGCGFRLTREKMNGDKLVLKLLAQDSDFDLTYLNSWFSSVTGVRDSGCYYPLNNIPGVNDYLERCFPYVREAVTDKDGNIWMLPVNVNIPVLLCNTGICKEYGITPNMTYEAFYEALEGLNDQERKMTLYGALGKQFMTEYFYREQSVDTPVFRKTMNCLQKINGMEAASSIFPFEKFIFLEEMKISSADLDYTSYYYGETTRAYSMPKISETESNVGTCQGFVVNPKSKNLEQTLQYVATWVAFQMNKQEAPVFFSTPQYEEDTLRGSVYKIYQNGAITLGVDEALYDGYNEVISGQRELEPYIDEIEKKLHIYFGE